MVSVTLDSLYKSRRTKHLKPGQHYRGVVRDHQRQHQQQRVRGRGGAGRGPVQGLQESGGASAANHTLVLPGALV